MIKGKTEEVIETKSNLFQDAQGILSLGYLYLVVMGILNETMKYGQLGIDIVKYSSILDILMSPISRLSTNAAGIGFFLLLVSSVFIFPSYLTKRRGRSWVKNTFKLEDSWSIGKVEKTIFSFFIAYVMFGIFGFFIGTGIGSGIKIKSKIKNDKVAYKDRLEFLSGEQLDVWLIGKNSSFLFYLTKENDSVVVSPISGTIKSITEVQ